MPLDAIAADIARTLETRNFSGSLKFDCGEAGVIVLADGTASTSDRETDCTLTISEDNLVKLLTGKLNPMTGVVLGKLKVSGDLGVAMGLAKLLG
ncbi:SCP2 sterol-binding domain-containing protein [Defluviimonas sp. D31]|uniref:SCP2 sterol-binding domain-containing protein n=1 Tax=Defluviimonas salinarum TaxID=2992147 RepID=A0ABT3J188_9RHOB|nr:MULTISPECIES: SCP2 sterol-binding domain-containing protein [Defluviimonas]MCW3781454.1 SCP2 sterol-binding domain-containing protein [Defluviimonas salinarum]MDW4549180.1 SCP2 sterol-binding domain-containing protein [Defluviimonas sp. D31]